MKKRMLAIPLVLACLAVLANTARAETSIARANLYVRDPFIVPVEATRTYHLYCTSTQLDSKPGAPRGVLAFTSSDLRTWTGPERVFTVPSLGWTDPAGGQVWAPEVHVWDGRYYLFVTLGTPSARFLDQPGRPGLHLRATGVFVSDSPLGPFEPITREPQTPADWMSLDGTLHIEDGKPWMVFCHEWFQTIDGTYEAMPLTPDLARPVAAPQTLFAASEIPWTRDLKSLGIPINGRGVAGYVSDGCFVHRGRDGTLFMLHASFSETRYSVGYSRSESGRLAGPWVHAAEPLFKSDGGHGMIFRTFDGRTVLALHAPNDHINARCRLFEINDSGTELRLGTELP